MLTAVEIKLARKIRKINIELDQTQRRAANLKRELRMVTEEFDELAKKRKR